MDLGPNAGFIWASYAAAAAVIAILAAWVVLDGRRQKQLIAGLEARGVKRRSKGRQPTTEDT